MTLDRHNGHQVLVLGEARRIAGKQRLDVEGLIRLDEDEAGSRPDASEAV
jgi:hypothetical protein